MRRKQSGGEASFAWRIKDGERHTTEVTKHQEVKGKYLMCRGDPKDMRKERHLEKGAAEKGHKLLGEEWRKHSARRALVC